MKNHTCKEQKAKNTLYYLLTSISIILFVFSLSIGFSTEITIFVRNGLKLCFGSIIGAVFPFLILTDILTSISSFEKIKTLRVLFEKIFNINGYAISAYIIGLLCGFPVGVKVSDDLYRMSIISKDEYERLIGFSNNTGPAFVICGVGYSMRSSLRDGIILYFAMVFSSIIAGAIFGIFKKKSNTNTPGTPAEFNLVSSVKAAAMNTLNICAFITLFSLICGFLEIFLGSNYIFAIILSFLEVGNAAKTFSTCTFLTKKASLALTSFAISFSGISVYLQAKSFITAKNINTSRYLSIKLIQGIISSLICLFIT